MSNSRGPLKISGTTTAMMPGSGRHIPHAPAAAAPAKPVVPANSDSDDPTPADWELVQDIDIALVDDSPYQTLEESKDRYDNESISELGQSIASEGQREPIQVRRIGHRFELIAGHRRIRALRMIGRRQVRALIEVMTDEEAERALAVHNEGIKTDPDYRRAKRYQRALDRGWAKTQEDLARMFATKQGTVSKRLKMLELPVPIRAPLDRNPALFSMKTAAVIADLLKTYPDEIELITRAVLRLETEGAEEGSIKSWVLQTMQARTAAQERTQSATPRVITDRSGRAIYTARLDGRVLTVRLNGAEVDPVAVLESVSSYLQKQAQEAEPTAGEGSK